MRGFYWYILYNNIKIKINNYSLEISTQQSNLLNTQSQYLEQVIKWTMEKNSYSVYFKSHSS